LPNAREVARTLGLTLVVRIDDGTSWRPRSAIRIAIDDDPFDAIICVVICETYADELYARVLVVDPPMRPRADRAARDTPTRGECRRSC
jgi:hypothetical protein